MFLLSFPLVMQYTQNKILQQLLKEREAEVSELKRQLDDETVALEDLRNARDDFEEALKQERKKMVEWFANKGENDKGDGEEGEEGDEEGVEEESKEKGKPGPAADRVEVKQSSVISSFICP